MSLGRIPVAWLLLAVALAAALVAIGGALTAWGPRLRKERGRHARAVLALARSEERYRDIFRTAPPSLRALAFSGARAALEERRRQGVGDVRAHLAAHAFLRQEALGLLFVRDLNREGLALCGAQSVAELQGRLGEIFLPETEAMMESLMAAMAEGRS